MEFDTNVQKNFYETVGGYLRQSFGELSRKASDTAPCYVVEIGAGIVYIMVASVNDELAAADMWCWLDTSGIELTPAFMRYMLEANDGTRVGNFGLEEDGQVSLSHGLFSHGCDKKLLAMTVQTLASSAEDYVLEIQQFRS